MSFTPLVALADELGFEYGWLVGKLERRGLSPETVAVECGEPYGRPIDDVRDLLMDGPTSATSHQAADRNPDDHEQHQEVFP